MVREQHYRGIFSHPLALSLITAVAASGLWILFVGSTSRDELLVGMVTVLLTTLFCRVVFRSATLGVELRWRDILEVWRIPGNLVQDCWTILQVFARDLAGNRPQPVLRLAPFAASLHDPVRTERMVLAVTYMTMTPNSIVIGIDPARSVALYHQLELTNTPALAEKLGAQT